MRTAKLNNTIKTKRLDRSQNGQAMAEYVIVCSLLAMVLIVPFEGKRLYVWVIEALQIMHIGYTASMSAYAYPL